MWSWQQSCLNSSQETTTHIQLSDCLFVLQSQVPTELRLLWLFNMCLVLLIVYMAKQLAEQLDTNEFQFLHTVLLSGKMMKT